jgi:Cof subfamily protein (haloacid dehalogenase superfamily)
MALSPRPYDLVVLDLDGTIIDPYARADISPAVHEAIAAVQATGCIVTIGTGRTLDYIRTQMPGAVRLTHPVITTQGAIVGDPNTGHVLAEIDLPLAEAQAIAAWVDANRYPTAFYFSEGAGHTHVKVNRRGRDAEEQAVFEHLLGFPMEEVSDFGSLLTGEQAHAPIKIIAFNHNLPGNVDLKPDYERRFGERLSIVQTHPWLVEATAAGVDKGSGLRILCEHLQIGLDRVMVVGDSDNDIPMLRLAGMAVAMGNANARVKAVAHWIAPALEEEGAAIAMRKWVLGEESY